MMILNDEQKREVADLFNTSLEQPVKIVYFTQKKSTLELPSQVDMMPCEYCEETGELLGEITELSDKLDIEVYDFARDKDQVDKYKVTEIPATVIQGDKDYGIRYYGIPSGYEFSALLDAIINISKRGTKLTEGTKQALSDVTEPVHLKVFVTPT